MKILPYDSFTIVTPHSLPVVLQRLSENVEPPKALRFSSKHALYQGSVSEDGFQIMRIISHRNLLLPKIQGKFEVQPHQTLVHIQIRLPTFVMAFLGFWLLFWYSGIVPIILADNMVGYMAALFLGMPILMLIMFSIAFWSEVNLSRNHLINIIQGDVVA